MQRFTRIADAFSKKLDNHVHMIALCAVCYYWPRIHKTLWVTPAMAAGLTDKLLGWEDILAILDASEEPKKRGPYKKREDA
jgi:hypothetical protein